MDEKKRSIDFARKRSQAQRNVESHIADILFDCAKNVVTASKRYRGNGRLTNESALLSYAKNVTAEAEEKISDYIAAYSKASCKILGIDSENVESFLVSDIFGKTTKERNTIYLANFAEDIVRTIKAGTLMGYSDQQLLSAVRTGYKDPYHASVVTKAKKKDINIDVPSYGKGIFRNAYQNIVRNARQVVGLSWSQAEQDYGKDTGAIGFKVLRGSSYPCDICDEQTKYIHKLGENPPLYHTNCRCYCEFIYKKSK